VVGLYPFLEEIQGLTSGQFDQQCVDESLGRDDCEEEFADLDLAQARHERAVADYHNACR
jgi:hypothetical protein